MILNYTTKLLDQLRKTFRVYSLLTEGTQMEVFIVTNHRLLNY